MGYTGKSSEIFFTRLLPGFSGAARGAWRFGKGKCRIAHEASLSYFLIFCN